MWAWVVCVGGWRREEEGGRGRKGSVMQDLFCRSHISRIWSVVCLDVVRHFHRTRRKGVLNFASCTDTETILRSGTYHWDAWLVVLELTLLISAWRWSTARRATWIWWP